MLHKTDQLLTNLSLLFFLFLSSLSCWIRMYTVKQVQSGILEVAYTVYALGGQTSLDTFLLFEMKVYMCNSIYLSIYLPTYF